ncbi:cell division protein FtsN [Heyndrickxia shackletonii]|uniref:Cell division protein FtsN n=1 Tax=Heyndrickxia shackletonii TaxID=157838 RepID=A0A0Q3WVL7_9BACI|nr:CalY family protein [Heyndrickxia shackletonii]KQL52779.1 cell division protein FtsN [Heyndrickxia shackletonii]MBB2481991.1 M73 family metallopeptidase [Bacillus sp. APMAM]NEZ00089.1 cell division protein FtsN [Heyndrickxia shackletonii]RTZ54662.1 cell division protein FtsN [Bacillus sp. SAJ1]
MSLKKKLGMGIASAALGLSLIGGGTYAYFNDVETTNNSFAAGTLNLTAKPTTIIDVKDIKPGDWMDRDFTLKNDGSLDISKVLLTSSYQVVDAKGDNLGEDFGKYIEVTFLVNKDKATEEVYKTTLDKLSATDVTDRDLLGWILGGENPGLKAGDTDSFKVRFTFKETGKDQNKFQGDQLKLTWNFDAKQTAGQSK